MELEKPKISVIVPVYNVEAYLEKCLLSLAKQTYPNIEVIMVDDGSVDNGGNICDAWTACDERFQVIHLPKNSGLSEARNEGVIRASGTYISFVDSDDYVEFDMLETLYNALVEACADVSICGSYGLHITNGSARTLSPEEAACCMARRFQFLWTAWGKLFTAKLVKQITFDKDAICCEDLLFFYQILKRVQKIVYVPNKLYHYIYREGSLINNGVTEKRCIVLSILDQICEDAAVCFPEVEVHFHQVALDTAARLAMQIAENGADGRPNDYMKRLRDNTRRHFSWKALMFSPDSKSAVAQMALCCGVTVFTILAAVYRLAKSLRKNSME